MKLSSIQTKLILILLPFFLLSFSILSGVSYYLSNQSLTSSIDETAISIGTDYANRTQFDIKEKIIILEDLASNPVIQSGDDKELIIRTMAEAKNRIGKFITIFFILPDGSGLRYDGSSGNYNSRDYFKKVLATKKPVVSEPLVSTTTGKLSVMLAVPVFHNGQLTGVLGGTYTLESLSEMVGKLKFKDTGYGFILDASGTVIAHPTMPGVIGKLKLTDKKINNELKLQQTELDDRLINLFETAAKDNKLTKGFYKFVDGLSCIGVFVPIDLPGGMRWVMVVAAPETEVTKETVTLARTMIAFSLLFIVIALLFIIIMSKRIARPIKLIRDECLLLTQGDLREREIAVLSQDEIGQLAQGFATMRATLRTLVTNVQSQAEQVAASSQELTASSHQSAEIANHTAHSITEIANGTDKQAASTTHISAVAKQISKNAGQISDTTHELSGIAIRTSSEAEQGRLALEQAISHMEQIGQGSEAVQTAISELERESMEISNIVTLISTIAGQTNLLALNAAIEAAKAGEHGRGFAVVADEVRKLAEESNQATQQIRSLIEKNHLNMNQAVCATQAGAEGIKVGIRSVDSAGETFKMIVDSIMKLSKQIKDISESIKQLVEGSQALASSIHEIEKVSKDNSAESQNVSAAVQEQTAAMQQIAASSQSLAHLAAELQEDIAKFRV